MSRARWFIFVVLLGMVACDTRSAPAPQPPPKVTVSPFHVAVTVSLSWPLFTSMGNALYVTLAMPSESVCAVLPFRLCK